MSHLLANLFKFNQRYYPSDDELSLLIPALKKYFTYPERHQMRNTITEDLSVTLKKISPHWTQRLIRIWFNNNKHQYLLSNNIKKISELGENEAVLLSKKIINSGFNIENQNFDFNINNSQNQKESFQFSDQPQKLALSEQSIIDSSFNKENQNIDFNINNSQNQKESFQFSDQPQKLALSEQSIIDSSFNKENQNIDFNINNSQNHIKALQISRESIYISTPYDAMSESIYSEHVKR